MSHNPPVSSSPGDFNGSDPPKPSLGKLDHSKPSEIHSLLSRLREFARLKKLKALNTAIAHLEEAELWLDIVLQDLLEVLESGNAGNAAPVAQTFSFLLKPSGAARIRIDGLPSFTISPHLASLLWPLAQDWGTATDEIVAFKPKAVILERVLTESSTPLPAKRLASSVNKLREAFARHGLPKSLIETNRKQGLRLRVLRATMAQSNGLLAGG